MNDWISVRARQLFDGLAARLKDVQEPALVIAALIGSAQQLGGQLPQDATPEGRQRWLIERLRVLANAAGKQCHQMARALDEAMVLVAERDERLGSKAGEGDVRRAVEDAAMRFWGIGVVPLILLFSEEEQNDIGETPFAHLVALLMAAEAGDRMALDQALELSRKLAAKAQLHAWEEPAEYRIAREVLGVPEDHASQGGRP